MLKMLLYLLMLTVWVCVYLCVYGCTHTHFYDLHGKVIGKCWSWLFLLLFDTAFLLVAAILSTPGLLAFELHPVLWEAACFFPAAQS